MALTQRDSVLQMLAQLRTLDPAISAEIGTPERKILDTVAQEIADSSLDLAALGSALDIDSKFGAALDRFLAIFNFERQKATAATGFVTFSRQTASTQDIRIPNGTQVVARAGTNVTTDVFFRTTFDVILRAGQTFVSAPVVAVVAGTLGNVSANTITNFVSTVLGVTEVTNEIATGSGRDAEEDDALKVRFGNTVFRNVTGTEDQYLGLAVSTVATKANVVGPISRYREYLQVPSSDDATGGNGNANEYTSALSTIPYSKHVYDTIPYFVSNGQLGLASIFYRQDVDYVLNLIDKNRGDAYRLFLAGQGPDPTGAPYQPNLTFKNIYTGVNPSVVAVRKSDIVLFEHSYMSSASRNDYARSVFNAVDIFVDGSNDTAATCVVPSPSVNAVFVNDPTSPYHYDNYRRVGEPEHRPLLGNGIQPLFHQPVTVLPTTLTIADNTYTLGTHYWLVEEVSDIGGTVRSRNGIEWSKYLPGTASGLGALPALSQSTPYTVTGYQYDRNISDLQIAVEGAAQVGADVLAHRSKRRYFKLDITVMYAPGSAVSTVNADINTAVGEFFSSAFFGATIQLSDLLQTIHNVSGVDNVRWSRDLPPVTPGGSEISTSYNRVVECDAYGAPLLNVHIDRITAGDTVTVHDSQALVISGGPAGGTFVLSYNSTPTAAIAYNASSATVQTQLRTASSDASLTVTGSGTSASPFIATFSTTAVKPLLTLSTNSLTGGPSILNADYFLKDDELPALPSTALSTDTVAGFLIRPKAQNTWTKG